MFILNVIISRINTFVKSLWKQYVVIQQLRKIHGKKNLKKIHQNIEYLVCYLGIFSIYIVFIYF